MTPGPVRGDRRARHAAVVLLLAGVGLGAPGCGQAGPTNPAPPSAATPSAGATASSTPAASPSLVIASPSLPPGVSVDPGLLEVLPAEIDGVALEPDPDTAAQIGADLQLIESARSIAVAVAIAPGASDSADLAVASVVRLLPDVYDEAFFQEWRDTYNEAACEVADGVESEDETGIDGRQVYTGTCVGGARTYHAYLEDQGFIVSVTATGERRFGELIMAGLAG